MTEEEFLKLINDYVRGLLCHSENWKYHCFKIVTEKCSDSGRTEIRIQYSPYKVENNNEAKEVKKTLVRNCDVGTQEEQQQRFREFCRRHEAAGECGIGRTQAKCPCWCGPKNPDCALAWVQMPYKLMEE